MATRATATKSPAKVYVLVLNSLGDSSSVEGVFSTLANATTALRNKGCEVDGEARAGREYPDPNFAHSAYEVEEHNVA
jgi:hypothetical protein